MKRGAESSPDDGKVLAIGTGRRRRRRPRGLGRSSAYEHTRMYGWIGNDFGNLGGQKKGVVAHVAVDTPLPTYFGHRTGQGEGETDDGFATQLTCGRPPVRGNERLAGCAGRDGL